LRRHALATDTRLDRMTHDEQQFAAFAAKVQSGFHALERAHHADAEAEFRAALELRDDHEVASLGLFHTLAACGRWFDALAEAARFVRLADSEDYRELFAGAFLDDVDPALRAIADGVRSMFRLHDEWNALTNEQRHRHGSWPAFLATRVRTA